MKKLLLLCSILILTGCTQTGSSNFGDDATLTKLNPWIRSGENVLLSGSSRNIGSTTTPISVMHVLGIDLGGDFKTAWPTGTGSGWATSSSDYWETTKLRWATTSADYWETTQSPRGGTGDWATTSEAYYWTSNFTSNFNTAYNATTTLNGFTPANYLLTTDFASNFNTNLNATTTLDLTSLVVTKATTTNFAIGGLLNCDTIDTDASGTLRCGTDATGAGGTGSNWIFGAAQDFITPSSTVGIILQASSTITSLVLPGTVSGTGFTNAWNALYNATTTLNGFTPTNYLLTTNFDTEWNSNYNATTTLNGLTPWTTTLEQNFWNGTSTWAGFQSEFNKYLNATTTWSAFDTNWNRKANATTTQTNFAGQFNTLYNATTTQAGFATQFAAALNATSTWAGFQGQFNTYLNATTTLDLTTLFATNLKSTNATTTKFTVGTTNPTNNYNFFLTGGAYLDSATTTDSLFVTGYASSTVGFRSGGLLDIGGVTTLRGITTTTNTTTVGGGLKVYKNASDSPTTTLEFL